MEGSKKKSPPNQSPHNLSITRRVQSTGQDQKRAYSKINTIPKNMFNRNGQLNKNHSDK
jgi:hypothetical protein